VVVTTEPYANLSDEPDVATLCTDLCVTEFGADRFGADCHSDYQFSTGGAECRGLVAWVQALGGTGATVQAILNPLINAALPGNIRSQFEISVNGSQFVKVQLRPWLGLVPPHRCPLHWHFKK
jgi:hypothetical protein